jgi:copper chaperone
MTKVAGMTCGGCVKSLTRALTAVPGVAKAEVSLELGQAVIDFDPGKVSQARLTEAIEDAGFSAG